MTKAKPKRKTATRSVSRPSHARRSRQGRDPKARHSKASVAAASRVPSSTKRDRILSMLRSASGASLAALAEEAQWQPHSVRGFLAGVVRKKLGLDLVSMRTEQGRIYRIIDKDSAGMTNARVANKA